MMATGRKAWYLGALAAGVLACMSNVWAFKGITHEQLNLRAAKASTLDERLKQELGFANGLVEAINNQEILAWIRVGGVAEDQFMGSEGFVGALNRSRYHFHNPILSWDHAGLNGHCFFIFPITGQASVRWAQSLEEQSGGSARWADARNRFKDALTLSSKAERDDAWANLFQILGQQMHLIADLAVPAHTRNDIHCTANAESFEVWAARDSNLRLIPGLEPLKPDPAIFNLGLPAGESVAKVPVARLWDTDQYNLPNPDPVLTVSPPGTKPLIGLAEYSNANFFSKNTVFSSSFPFPARTSVDPGVIVRDPKTGNLRRYLSKPRDGEVIDRLAVTSALDQFLQPDLRSKKIGLDDSVLAEYASRLFPRAVGYSAALLDYFFRGTLDVDLVEDSTDSSRFQLIGTNGFTSDELVDGTLRLYSDNPSGLRSQIVDFTPMSLKGVKPGDPLASSLPSFQPPENAERFVAVYMGTLGLEKQEGTFPGGVIGKVLGGVRVEEVFSDGVRWKLRTPKGVFLLPLMAAEFEDVRWGDADNILVACTPFGRPDPNQPNRNRVVAYELQREPGSVELVTVDTPDGPEAQVTKKTEALFPFGMSLGTTVQFSQSIQYRQQLAKFDPRKTVLRFEKHPEICPNCDFYVLDRVEIGPLQIQTVVEQAIPFSETFLVRLDPERNLDFGTVAQPYLWSLQDVTVDAAGRLLGVVVAFLLAPESPPVTVPFFGLNQAGAQEVVAQVPIFPFFPPEVTTLLWAVVNLNAQSVVASTADPTIVIAFQTATEAPAWVLPNSSPAPLVYAHFIEQRTGGGPNDGIDDQGWAGLRLQQVAPFPGLSVTALQTQEGERALSADGWLRTELKDELTKNGLLSLQVDVRTSTTDFRYDCASETTCFGLRVITSDGFVAHPPVQLQDARRSRPAPGGERLVFLASGLTPPLSTILVWDASPPRARVLQQFLTDFPSLGPATRAAVLASTLSFDGPQVLSTDFLLPLEGTQGPTVFQGVDVNTSFALTLLNPSFVYSVQDLKFFSSTPPLRRTALPAKLADLPDGSNPVGDYHAIRVP